MDFSNGYFYNPSKGRLPLDGVMEEIFAYMSEKPEKFYDVIVGCDSPSSEDPHFPAVIVVLRKGEGGRFFLKKIRYSGRKFYTWKTRILEEVLLSCELALLLREKLKEGSRKTDQKLDYQFLYIHADIGGRGETKDMIKEVAGLIRSNGFKPIIKPESYAASSVADRYC